VLTAFDGEGARLFGGRWNSAGTAMVYASRYKSTAILETRVHIEATSKRKDYKSFAFRFDKELLQVLLTTHLPGNWRQEPVPLSTQQLGDDWAKSLSSVILGVPSIIVPEDLNYLINPRHPDFSKIQIDKPTDFAFDERLFK
jgi:RES domain-containing protein